MNSTKATAQAVEFLAFRIGSEEYIIPLAQVREIRPYEVATRLPGAPRHLLGVVNLRGLILPVVDLRISFGVEPNIEQQTVSIVLDVLGRRVAVVVDSVNDVIAPAATDMKPVPAAMAAVAAAHVLGIVSVGARTLQSLDIDSLMASSEMGLFESVRQPSVALDVGGYSVNLQQEFA